MPDAIELIVLRVREQTLNQALQLLRWQCRDPHEPRVQALKLRFAHRVEIDTMNALVSARDTRLADERTYEDHRPRLLDAAGTA